MKWRSTVDNLEFEDLSYDVDGDGDYALVKINTGEYIPVSKIASELVVKSANSGTIKRAVAQGWLVEEQDYTGASTVDETNLAQVYLVTLTITNTITLPTAVGVKGRSYYVKKMSAGTNSVVLSPTLTQTIDGNPTYAMTFQYDYVQILSDNENWQVITSSEVDVIASAFAGAATAVIGNLTVTQTATINSLAVSTTASVLNLNVSNTATAAQINVGTLTVTATASVLNLWVSNTATAAQINVGTLTVTATASVLNLWVSNTATMATLSVANLIVTSSGNVPSMYTTGGFNPWTVTVTHNLGHYPIVQIINASKQLITTTLTHTSVNVYVAAFASSITATFITM